MKYIMEGEGRGKFTYLHHLWVGSGSVVGLLWLLHVVENIIVIISTFT